MEPISREKRAVGQHISTKSVGNNFRQDVTGHYKFREDSEDERKAVHRAHRYARYPRDRAYDIPDPDVSFQLDLPDAVSIGDDFDIKVQMRNLVSDLREVNVTITAVVAYYTGVSSEQVGSITLHDKLDGNAELERVLPIKYTDYMAYLKPESVVKVFMKGRVVETGKSYAHIGTFQLCKPELTVTAPEEVVIGEDFDVTVTFTNPLQQKLTGNFFHFEGPGITHALTVPYRKAIAAGTEATQTVNLSARKSGKKELVVTFSSDQLSGMAGAVEIYVKYSG